MPKSVISKSQLEKYLVELARDEVQVADDMKEYEQVRARVEMGLRRYISLRDFVAEQVNESPYSQDIEWPAEALSYDRDGEDVRGRFRFTGLRVGDAILEVLREARARDSFRGMGWMSLDEIIDALSEGGFAYPDPVQARAVNAALRNTTGVRPGKRGETLRVYRIDPDIDEGLSDAGQGENDPDDLPFE